MNIALLLATAALTAVFLFSGIGKLRAIDAARSSFLSLGLPLAWAERSLPVVLAAAEVASAVLLWTPQPVAPFAGALMVLLCLALTAVIVHALQVETPPPCGCFGEALSKPVSWRTLLRNLLLLALAVFMFIGTLFGFSAPATLISLGTAEATAALITLTAICILVWTITSGYMFTAEDLHHSAAEGRPDVPHHPHWPGAPIPTYGLHRSDGTVRSLRDIGAEQATLLIRLTPTCTGCRMTVPVIAEWADLLHPIVRVFAVLPQATDDGVLEGNGIPASHIWHDVDTGLETLFHQHGSPMAVLLGTQGEVAGQPTAGHQHVSELVEQIAAELTEAGLLPR